jgi:hypothetical protein
MATSRIEVKAPTWDAGIAHREDLEFVLLAPLSGTNAHVGVEGVEGGHDGLEAFRGLFCRVMFVELALGGLHLSLSPVGCLGAAPFQGLACWCRTFWWGSVRPVRVGRPQREQTCPGAQRRLCLPRRCGGQPAGSF